MRRFVGVRDQEDGFCRVYVDDEGDRITPRRRLQHHRGMYTHVPTGFEWGYGGSGPAELARALVVEVTGDPNPSPRLYEQLKARLVQQLSYAGWTLDEAAVRLQVEAIAREIRQQDGHA